MPLGLNIRAGATNKRTRTSTGTDRPTGVTTTTQAKLDVAIAGGGLGGLTLACYLAKHGVDVTVYEKTREFGKFGGPIQIQSNALAVLDDIDPALSATISAEGCMTGNRKAAIHDGPSGQQLAHFDPGRAARRRNLPLTHVVPRPTLQASLLDVLQQYAPNALRTGSPVVSYSHDEGVQVQVGFSDGSTRKHDVLVGADGIWSAVRSAMHGVPAREGAHYSGYRCFTGVCSYTPTETESIAYRVHLGGAVYFVASDVGRGRVQWYAFVSVHPPDGEDEGEGDLVGYLRRVFSGWGGDVEGVLAATHEADVESRYIYDRPPLTSGWTDGRVALLGDSCHAMMPNLGQGGCMAIESAYTLGGLLSRAQREVEADPHLCDLAVRAALEEYQNKRMVRTAVVHGVARISSDVLRMYGSDRQLPGWGLFWNTIGPTILGGSMPVLLEYLYINLVEKKPVRQAETDRELARVSK